MHDRYLADMVTFLQARPYGLRLDDLMEKTVNEIIHSGSFRHLTAADLRSQPGQLWTTDEHQITLDQARAPHEAETLMPVRHRGTANGLALWFSATLAPDVSLSVGPGDPPTQWGMTTALLSSPVELTPEMVVRARGQDRPSATDRERGQVGRSRCRTPTGRNTMSRRSGRRSTTERAGSDSAR